MKLRTILAKFISILVVSTTGILVAYTFVMPWDLRSQFQTQKATQNRPLATADTGQTTSDVPEAVYREKLAHLKMLREAGTLPDLISEVDEIEKQWGANGGERYGLLFQEFLSALGTSRIIDHNPDTLDISQKYAVIALKNADSYDLETEWSFLRYLRYPMGPIKLDGLGTERRLADVKLWLHALHRLESEKDKNFDPNETGPMNAEPPPGANGYPGMSPDRIKDPILRAQYEKAINENNRKIRYMNHQFKLLQHEPSIIRDAVKYISRMYAQEPSNIQELTVLLRNYKISSELSKNIINQTEKERGDKQ